MCLIYESSQNVKRSIWEILIFSNRSARSYKPQINFKVLEAFGVHPFISPDLAKMVRMRSDNFETSQTSFLKLPWLELFRYGFKVNLLLLLLFALGYESCQNLSCLFWRNGSLRVTNKNCLSNKVFLRLKNKSRFYFDWKCLLTKINNNRNFL